MTELEKSAGAHISTEAWRVIKTASSHLRTALMPTLYTSKKFSRGLGGTSSVNWGAMAAIGGGMAGVVAAAAVAASSPSDNAVYQGYKNDCQLGKSNTDLNLSELAFPREALLTQALLFISGEDIILVHRDKNARAEVRSARSMSSSHMGKEEQAFLRLRKYLACTLPDDFDEIRRINEYKIGAATRKRMRIRRENLAEALPNATKQLARLCDRADSRLSSLLMCAKPYLATICTHAHDRDDRKAAATLLEQIEETPSPPNIAQRHKQALAIQALFQKPAVQELLPPMPNNTFPDTWHHFFDLKEAFDTKYQLYKNHMEQLRVFVDTHLNPRLPARERGEAYNALETYSPDEQHFITLEEEYVNLLEVYVKNLLLNHIKAKQLPMHEQVSLATRLTAQVGEFHARLATACGTESKGKLL